MKSTLQSLEFFKGTALLSCILTAKEWSFVMSKRGFNYEAEIFEKSLPSSEKEVELWLIADEGKAKGWKKGEQVFLDLNKWNILKIKIENQYYETFLSLRLSGKLHGTLEEAAIEFSIRKGNDQEKFSEESFGTIKNLFTELYALALGSNVNDSNLTGLVSSTISKLLGISSKVELTDLVENYLKKNEIPAEKKQNGYVFQVVSTDGSWEVEIQLNQEKEKVILYSGTKIQVDLEKMEEIKEDLAIVNEEMNTGNFSILESNKILLLKSEIQLNATKSSEDIEGAFSMIFESMQAMILLLKNKYQSNIIFPS